MEPELGRPEGRTMNSFRRHRNLELFAALPQMPTSGVMRLPLFLSAFIFVARSLLAADAPTAPRLGEGGPRAVDIWPGSAPEETNNIGPERVRMSPGLDRKQVEVTEPTRLITAVSKRSITIYRPPKDQETDAAMVIGPGGGDGDRH